MANLDGSIKKNGFYENVLTAIKIVSSMMLVFFGYLKLNSWLTYFKIDSEIGNNSLQLAMVIYFTAWVYGMNHDTRLHRITHDQLNIEWKIEIWVYPIAFVLLAVFFLLCYIERLELFLILFLFFRILDFVGVKYVTERYVKNVGNRKLLKNEDILALRYLEDLFWGATRRIRFGFDIGAGIIMLILYYFITNKEIIIYGININLLNGLVLALVTISEIWMFLLRLHTKASIKVLGDIIKLQEGEII